jgi:hypothetical protein
MSLVRAEKVPADECATEVKKGFMNFGETFIADAQATELMKPGHRPFNHPAEYPQAASVFGPAFGQHGLHSSCAQLLAMWFGIIGAVTLHTVRPAAGVARLSRDFWNCVHKRQELGDIVIVGPGQDGGEGYALRLSDKMMLAACLASIGGIRTRFFPPQSARTEALSTMARDQSNLCAPLSWSKSNLWILSQTPLFCQLRSKRQQVIPEPQPISCGRSSQGIPVRRTKITPVNTLRTSKGLRPGHRRRRGLGGGTKGLISSHSSSFNIGFAMCSAPPLGEHMFNRQFWVAK